MSRDRNPNEGFDACTDTAQSQWRQERLFEARGILADIVHHPETLVRLTCQIILSNSLDPIERDDALGVMRLLDGHPPKAISAAPKGGAV